MTPTRELQGHDPAPHGGRLLFRDDQVIQGEISTMTAPDSPPLHALAENQLAVESPDLLHAMIKTFADALMSVRQTPPEKPLSFRI